MPPDEAILAEIVLGDLRTQLGDEDIEQAIAAGRDLRVEQAAALIRDLAAQVADD